MKDIVCGTAASATLARDAAIYKEVVVVGNGPSGIALSYMLSGNWPYWQAERVDSHPDELLRARLNYAGAEQSLVQQDLQGLADGLEGRSTNPVSLLLDSLQNPCADIGMTLPSMLHYQHHPERRIDHVVLGKGPPGGSWHRMDPNLRTLSLSTWMSLPGYDYHTWEEAHPEQPPPLPTNAALSAITTSTTTSTTTNSVDRPAKLQCRHCSGEKVSRDRMTRVHKQHNAATCKNCVQHDARQPTSPNNNTLSASAGGAVQPLPRRNLALQRQVSKEVQTRALVSRVAEYYAGYVKQMQLAANFVNDTVVTSVQPLVGGVSGHRNARWIVQGKKLSGKPFAYVCRNVVLAVGASDLPNRLGLHGEGLGHSWIKHELPQLELVLENLTQRERSKLKPVLIIGAGLSAADAVTICRSSQVPVIHVYRNSSVGLDKMLPEAVYPEYHAVHKMMKESSVPYDLYTPLAEHTLVDVTNSNPATGHHQVTLLNQKTGETRRYDVSFCAILIGSRPDLRILKHVHQPRVQLCHAPAAVSPMMPNTTTSTTVYEHLTTTLKLLDPAQSAGDNWLLGRKMSWLKSLCAKCRTMNFCEWSSQRRNEYRKLCGHQTGRSCDCPRALLQPLPVATSAAVNGVTTAASANQVVSAGPIVPLRCALIKCGANHAADGPCGGKYASSTVSAVGDDPAAQLVALQLGEDPLRPIDCKTNPIAVNKYTNEVQRTGRRGLYAMGPLVGDNFVRFIAGGALAITSALHREND